MGAEVTVSPSPTTERVDFAEQLGSAQKRAPFALLGGPPTPGRLDVAEQALEVALKLARLPKNTQLLCRN